MMFERPMCDFKDDDEFMGPSSLYDWDTDDEWAPNPYQTQAQDFYHQVVHNTSENNVVRKEAFSRSRSAGDDQNNAKNISRLQFQRRSRFSRGGAATSSHDIEPEMCPFNSDEETEYGCSFGRLTNESLTRSTMDSYSNAMGDLDPTASPGQQIKTNPEASKPGCSAESNKSPSLQTSRARMLRGRNDSSAGGSAMANVGASFWNVGASEDDTRVSGKDTNRTAHNSSNGFSAQRDGIESGQAEEFFGVGRLPLANQACHGANEYSKDFTRPTRPNRDLLSESMLMELVQCGGGAQRFIEDSVNQYGEDAVRSVALSMMQKAAKEGDIGTTEKWVEVLIRFSSSEALVRPLNIVLGACMKRGNVSKALFWWDRFKTLGVRPALVTYNTMINVCIRGKDMTQAEWWMQRLLDDGVQPCHVSFTSLIVAYGQTGNARGAEYWFRRMRAVGLSGDLVLHNAMIDVYTKTSNLQKAEDWFYGMQDEGVLPCQRTYNMLIHACAKAGNMKRAAAWHVGLQRAGFRSDVYTYGALFEGCARSRDPDLAEYYLQNMCNERLTPNIVCLRSVLKVYLPSEDVARVARVLIYCMRNGGVARRVVDQALATSGAYIKSAVWEQLQLDTDSRGYGGFEHGSGTSSQWRRYE